MEGKYVRMAEWSKALVQVAVYSGRRGFKSHFWHHHFAVGVGPALSNSLPLQRIWPGSSLKVIWYHFASECSCTVGLIMLWTVMYYREMEGTFPNKDSIYEYVVDPKTKAWVHWEERLRSGWKYNPRYVCCWSVVVAGSPCYVVHYSKLQAICEPPPSLLPNSTCYFRQSYLSSHRFCEESIVELSS